MAAWRQCEFVLSVPIDDEVDPVEHVRTLLTPLFGDDWGLTFLAEVFD